MPREDEFLEPCKNCRSNCKSVSCQLSGLEFIEEKEESNKGRRGYESFMERIINYAVYLISEFYDKGRDRDLLLRRD